MTKRIEEEFNLPSLADALKAETEASGDQASIEVNSEVQSVADALQNVNPTELAAQDPLGTQDHIGETDEIYSAALKAYQDLMDLGFNIESKHAGANAFAPAAKMLEIALKASQSKSNKKLERIRAIIEKEKHDREMGHYQEEGVIEGEGAVMAFRKDLIEKIRKGEI